MPCTSAVNAVCFVSDAAEILLDLDASSASAIMYAATDASAEAEHPYM
jgi:hypothetical protein